MNRGWIYANLMLLAFGLAPARAADVQWIRAAFWDARYSATGWAGGGEATRDALQAAGYEILNADQLKTWMLARIADKKFSVVVFCRDTVPDTVTESRSSSCTVRQYLNAGGKVVWYADIPFYYQGYADGTRTNWGDAGATDILGFPTAGAPRGSNQTVTLTPLGLKWGLTQTWQSSRPAVPTVTPDLKILATDSSGNAAAWVKHYVKGDTFRGFVRFFDRSGQPDVGDLMRVAEYVDLRASNPQPANGATGVNLSLVRWDAGSLAVSHKVYFGTTPELTGISPVASVQAYYYAGVLVPGVTYYWRVDEVEADGTVRTGELWSFTAMPRTAWGPQPGDGVTYVDPATVLQWSGGLNALKHDVYFGTDRTAVESGAGDTLKASQVVRTTYTPGLLASATTYYWRVDETVGSSKVPGPVWSFVVRPVIAKTDPNLIGWWKLDDEGSGTAVDYSGWEHYGMLNGPQWTEGYFGEGLKFDGVDDYVDCGTDASIALSGSFTLTAWVRLNASTSDAKIASNQNNATGGYKMAVYGNKVELEIRTAANTPFLNRPIEGGTVLMPEVWYHLTGVYSQGQSLRTYVNGILDRERLLTDLLGASSGTLKIGRESYTSGFCWFGSLDDVRLYNRALTEAEIQEIVRGDPRLASDRQPARDAVVDIRDATALTWSPGETAAAHDVYLGTDKAAVKAAQTTSPEYRGRQDDTSFSLDGLVAFGGGAYFWRIDEVEADGTTLYPSNVWGFTIPDYLLVDDFESYNDLEDQGTRIYETWLDGLTNGTTSVVGNWDPPFAEQVIVHGGKQSMPIDYNNIYSPFCAEGEREFSPVQNWISAEVDTLSLWYRGRPAAFLVAADGLITMAGSGHDIWDNADDFRFAWKRVTGNASITIKVESIGNTNAWAKAGVMLRESLDADSKFAYMIVSAAQGVSFGWRDITAGTCTSRTQAGIPAPQWVKLTRTGDAFTARYSADGKTWSDIKNADGTVTSTPVTMTGSVYVGLCVTSHNSAATTSAGFTSPSTTGSVTGSWQVTAIGDDPEPANAPDRLYLVVEDSGGKSKVIPNADPGAVLTTTWTEWKIPLSDFSGVNLLRVKKLYIGVGDRGSSQATGGGRIYIDDIRLVK